MVRSKQTTEEVALDDLFQPVEDQRGDPSAGPPTMGKGFSHILETIFSEDVDVESEYAAIEDSLSIKESLTPGVLKEATNRAEEMARRAFRLYVLAKIEHDAYVRESDAMLADLRKVAVAALERDRVNKVRTKNITDVDVLSTIAELYPEQWKDLSDRRSKADGMLAYLSNLASLSKSRCFSVSKMLGAEERF